MNPEATSSTLQEPQSRASTGLELPVHDSAPPRTLLSTIRFTAVAVLIMFVLPWGSVSLTSCLAPEDSNSSSSSGEDVMSLGSARDIQLGSASGWDMARGESYSVPTIQGTTESISISPQNMAMLIPVTAILLVLVTLASVDGRASRNFVYVAAIIGSLVIGILTIYVPNHVEIPAQQQPVLERVIWEYTNVDHASPDTQQSDYFAGSHPSLEFRWNAPILLLLIVLLTAMGISGIAGLNEASPPPGFV